MSEDPLKALSEIASDAHARIQEKHEHINPVVGVRRGMRDAGIPADVMTIDCLVTRKRINLILHDGQPGVLLYQYITLKEEAGDDFESIAFSEMDAQTLVQWMEDYFR
ncbi:conserved hypothetical protein [gamma proteobacterium HTCC5015]|nr:conserved hypothetical protein [gamma proteobacterium HTCC5015]